MAVTPQGFRQQFNEFGDEGVFSDLRINTWKSLAILFLNATRWAAALDYGVSLFIAHQLVLEERNRLAVLAGGTPGDVRGPVTAEAVDKVSASYDVQAVSLDDEGFYGLTTYGKQLFYLAQQFGMGGLQL